MGHFKGVRTGIRQLIRKAPLETTVIKGLTIPTAEEIFRIKAYLIVRRNTTRDFIDFAALFDLMGVEKSLAALEPLDCLYPQDNGDSITRQLALQLADPKPWDLSETDLSHYKALQKSYTDWKEIRKRTHAASQKIISKKFMVSASLSTAQ